MVVAVREGVVKLKPVPINVPPDIASYQSSVVPVGLDADMTTVPGPHLKPFTGVVGAAGIALTVAVTCVLGEETQPVVEFLATAK